MAKLIDVYRSTAERFADRVARDFAPDVHTVILYGSVARGKITRESDIDVLVLCDDPQRLRSPVHDVRSAVGEGLADRTFLSCHLATVQHFKWLFELGSPFAQNVRDDGIVLYDDGSYESLPRVTVAPTEEFAKQCLLKSEAALDTAKANFADGRIDAAADRAYYAMFHAAEAAVSQEPGIRMPRTHSGMHTMFTRLFVNTGKLPKALGDDLSKAQKLRETSTYDVMANVGEQEVKDIVARAGAFVAAIRAYLNL